MKNLSRVLVLALGVSAFGLAGCATTGSAVDGDAATCSDGSCGDDAATMSQMSNSTCPFSGEPVDASTKTVSFQGKEVGFCCAKCVSKFEAMTDADKMAALGK